MKTKKILAGILCCALLFTTMPIESLAAQKPKVTKKLTITEGKSKKIQVKGRFIKSKKFKSSNKKIATVNKKGKVTAKKTGKTKITITVKYKKAKKYVTKKYICKVTVKVASNVMPDKTESALPTETVVVVPQTNTPIPTSTTNEISEDVITKSEWIRELMAKTEYHAQAELFDYDKVGNIIYSFDDIAEEENANIIETAVQYGIIPNSENKFSPNEAANREFLAVTAVRAIGFLEEETEISCLDVANINYVSEDAMALKIGLLSLKNEKFIPDQAITTEEKENALAIIEDIIGARKIDENHEDIIDYRDEVIEPKDVTQYIMSASEKGLVITLPTGTSLDDVVVEDKVVLPPTEDNPEGLAFKVLESSVSADGSERILVGEISTNIFEYVDEVDVEGKAKIVAEDVTAIEGVSSVEVITSNKTSSKHMKKAGESGSVEVGEEYKIEYTIDELNTTVSFEVTEVEYSFDFDKANVEKLYIGLPNILNITTEYEGEKEYSEKIGGIPVQLKGGFSVNVDVYFEASASGEVNVEFQLSNNLGIQYYKGEFHSIKSCEPSFEFYADADVEAGTKIQIDLLWADKATKFLENFGMEIECTPIYNISFPVGLHGDATLQIHNDKYTEYTDLKCVDFGYYMYLRVSVGDESLLGETFNLKKEWEIFGEDNSPLRNKVHIEKAEKWDDVEECTYKGEETEELPEESSLPSVTNAPEGDEENLSDREALKKIIAEQKALGASVSDDLDDDCYTWKDENLIGINWSNCNISGTISFAEFSMLSELRCDYNNISELDVSNNISLVSLDCDYNIISELDVSNNMALKGLDCSENDMSKLDVSNVATMVSLKCANNNLNELDVSSNVALEVLDCWKNNLSELDISRNTILKKLDCSGNSLSNLSVDNNTELSRLECYSNNLNELDITNNTKLVYLDCSWNNLSELNVQNNVGLINLSCDWNNISELDVSYNIALEIFECYENNLSELDVSNNIALQYFVCNFNNLSELDVSNNIALEVFECSENNLNELDISNNTKLMHLECYKNNLSRLDISNNIKLGWLVCYDNNISELNMSNNPLLEHWSCDSEVAIIQYGTSS